MPSDTATPLAPITIGERKVDKPSDTVLPPNPGGRMIIDLLPTDGGFRHHPVVRFDPVGMFTSGLMEQQTLYFCQEIERAQAIVRAANMKKKELE